MGPSEVAIGDARATWRDDSVVQFEIPYQFTSGSPRKAYQWRISFPPTHEFGFRQTEAWELKADGVQKTGIQVATTELDTFEIQLFEAESPDREYRPISNKATGKVPQYSATPPAADGAPAT